jgi:hypothetical protein
MRHEEEKWCLNLHILWLKAGDQNSCFFHKQARAHLSKNNIKEITLEDSSKITKFKAIKKVGHLHFNTLFNHESKLDHAQEVELLEHTSIVVTNT